MRTSEFLLLAMVVLCGCDQRGTPPTGSTKIDTQIGTTGTSAGGAGDSTGGPVDSTGGGTDSSLLLDTVRLNGPLASNQLVGGQRRSLVVYYPADRQLHFLASSDGAVSGTYDRLTVWDIDVTSRNVLYPFWSTNAENGFRDTIGQDTTTHKHVRFRLYTDVAATECYVQSDPGAILSVSVTAYSQIIPNAAAAGIFPSQLSAAATGALLFAGPSTTPIGKTSFRVRLPSY